MASNSRTTKLESVNTMLSTIGESPINTLTGILPVDATLAINILDEVNREVQSQGWKFNSSYKVSLTRDVNNKIPIGNDVMHIDTPSGNKTTKGTVQDTDGMFFEHFHIAKRLYINIIETLVSFYPDLHVVYNSSNHDYLTGFCLADTIATYFRNSKNI